MNLENTFLSKIIQYVGVLFTIGSLISQYVLREEFRKILNIGESSYYQAFTVAGLILGIAIFIGIFSNRSFLLQKWYPRKKNYKKYINSLQKSQNAGQSNQSDAAEIILEPFYLDGRRLATMCLVLSAVAFSFIFISTDPLLKSLFYLVFLLLIIFSITNYIILLYGEEDWKTRENLAREIISSKIANFFSPPYKVIERFEDTSNAYYPVTKIIVKVSGKKYLIVTDKNNPEKYFSVKPYKIPENEK